jgi:hypothetical protein
MVAVAHNRWRCEAQFQAPLALRYQQRISFLMANFVTFGSNNIMLRAGIRIWCEMANFGSWC